MRRRGGGGRMGGGGIYICDVGEFAPFWKFPILKDIP